MQNLQTRRITILRPCPFGLTNDARHDFIAGPDSGADVAALHTPAPVHRASLKLGALVAVPVAPRRHACVRACVRIVRGNAS